VKELVWPDKPEVVCDLCHRSPEPNSALCAGCADRVWCAERDAAETNEGEVR
jgi:hypothetical protein